MHLLDVDHSKNRAHLTLSGSVDVRQVEALLSELQVRLSELECGFHILCDLT